MFKLFRSENTAAPNGLSQVKVVLNDEQSAESGNQTYSFINPLKQPYDVTQSVSLRVSLCPNKMKL